MWQFTLCFFLNALVVAEDNVALQVTQCDVKSDVGFLLDASGSVEEDGFQQEKNFIKKVAEAIQLGKEKSRTSVVTFSDTARLSIKFNESYDRASFDHAVDDILYTTGGTRIDLALRLAKSTMFSRPYGWRSDVPDTLILLTDGKQSTVSGAEVPAKVAEELRKSGITIISVGIGDEPNVLELEKITGSPENVFTASTFDNLISDEFVRTLQIKTCKTGELKATVGNWTVTWSSGSTSSYSISQSNSLVYIRITSCSQNASCDINNEHEIKPSTSDQYRYSDGWMQVQNIHDEDGGVTIYLRMKSDNLSMVRYNPSTGFKEDGSGRREGSDSIKKEESAKHIATEVVCVALLLLLLALASFVIIRYLRRRDSEHHESSYCGISTQDVEMNAVISRLPGETSDEDGEKAKKPILERRLSKIDLQEFINVLNEDGSGQAVALARWFNFTKLQMSILQSYISGVHMQHDLFLDALQALAVPIAEVIEACEAAEMPEPLLDDLIELGEGRELFSELEPLECHHKLAMHLVGDPANPAIKTWRNVATELNQIEILNTISSTIGASARLSAGYYLVKVLTARGITVDDLQQKLIEMNDDKIRQTFATTRLQMKLLEAIKKKHEREEKRTAKRKQEPRGVPDGAVKSAGDDVVTV